MPATLESIEAEIATLHETLESQGLNSRGVTDIFGRKFSLPVDDEHKAKKLGLTQIFCNFSNPHMRAFHTSWFGFFSSFFSTFAAAALIAYIGPDLNLTAEDKGNAGIAAVAGTIFFRLAMGYICDKVGARRGLGTLLLLVTPPIICFIIPGVIVNAGGFIAARCVIGWGLATFVACQTWCSQQFSKSVVGMANATAAGWGNLGGGVTNLTMPYIFLIMMSFANDEVDRAWRLCYIVPLVLHVVGAAAVFTARDLPDGNYAELEKSGAKQKTDSKVVLVTGVTNINAWLLTLTYGFCFGVELTMNNKAVNYFYTYYAVTPQIAGILGSCFGLMNLFARSWGGILSDAMNVRYGMRGRLWSMWVVQALEGMMCIIMGQVTIDMASPDRMLKPGSDDFVRPVYNKDPLVQPQDGMWGMWNTTNPPTGFPYTYNTEYTFTINSTKSAWVKPCGSNSIKTPDTGVLFYGTENAIELPLPTTSNFIVVGDVMDEECVRNQGTLGVTMVVMVLFSIFVQMAEGLHFGVVPYVSAPALGVVSGMVGAGGNFGAVMGSKFIVGPPSVGPPSVDKGFINLGAIIMGTSLLFFGMYFPEHGGMLFKKGALGNYDPQLYKPVDGERGADQMDYSKAADKVTKNGASV
mmetsp:Transcript_22582/g.66302  ORF Transcript_22582/g.66302 Transcript_22582/m.66302 type:complete len:636 (+) Transcript_22582:84-1991(+)